MIRPTLLVLAAGMATRYGKLKQLDGFGPHGETIIDYSVYDAIKAGFGKIVFVIRKSIEEEFNETMLRKFKEKISVATVSQELDTLPDGYDVPSERVKPWGTGHAVWVAGKAISEPFAVINGDDFYGYRSFRLAVDFLRKNSDEYRYALVGYPLSHTLSDYGAVSRGICSIGDGDVLEGVVESTHIRKKENKIIAESKNGADRILKGNEIVSMNMMAFHPSVFAFFEDYFKGFLNERRSDPGAEFYLPEVVNKLIISAKAQVKVLHSPEEWFGVTYPEDKPIAVEKLKALTAAGAYPEDLWGVF